MRWKVSVSLMILGACFAVFVSLVDGTGKRAVAEARQVLRREGFKTELAEFDFSTAPELRSREHAVTNASFGWSNWGNDYQRRSFLNQETPSLMERIADDAVLVVWQQERLPSREGENLWPRYRELFKEDQPFLDAATAALLAGPIRYELNASQGMGMLLRHLAPLKSLATTLGQRAMVNLHEGESDSAWTNLLAATRLVTAWEIEPVEVSHLVRLSLAGIAFNSTWQMLQTNAWSAAQLSQLQREWESVDYFKALPEMVAFTRASAVAACQQERTEALELGVQVKEMMRAPRYAWSLVKDLYRCVRYRQGGSYEDEVALLQFYRNRELEMQTNAACSTWRQMQPLPGVTNLIFFQSKHPSRIQSMLNLRNMSGAAMRFGPSFLLRVAEGEMRRRLIITVLALEQYQRQYKKYPETLAELQPEFLQTVLADFSDGQPLRYRRGAAGAFVLYSIGPDGVDDGGQMPHLRRDVPIPDETMIPGWVKAKADIVWPRAATTAEVEEFHRRQWLEQRARLDQSEEAAAEWRWEQTAWRQARVETLLKTTNTQPTANPIINGRPLNELLQNKLVTGTNQLSMAELLSLKPIVTGTEPETATFELPIAYDVLTNLGGLQLYIDPVVSDDSDAGLAGCTAAWLECRRATSGSCLLVWDTIYEAPGVHALQVGLWLEEGPAVDIVGPLTRFTSSNLCQFSAESAVFNLEFGATLLARLPEANASFSVDIKSPEGKQLHAISGNTTNGVIKIFWDLMNDRGVRMTNESFGTVFQVTLTASGRTQTMRGP